MNRVRDHDLDREPLAADDPQLDRPIEHDRHVRRIVDRLLGIDCRLSGDAARLQDRRDPPAEDRQHDRQAERQDGHEHPSGPPRTHFGFGGSHTPQ